MPRCRWKVSLACPHCFRTGYAIFSYEAESKGDIASEFLPEGFLTLPSNRHSDGVEVFCLICNVSARRKPRFKFLPKRLLGIPQHRAGYRL